MGGTVMESRGNRFPGERAFRREDAVRFFGREREAKELSRAWRTHPVTILYGSAGCGKSSLLAAGVLPLLDPAGNDVLPVGGLRHRPGVPAALVQENENPFVLALLSSWSPYQAPTELVGQTVAGFLGKHPPRRVPSGDPLPLLAAIDHVDDAFAGPAAWQRHRAELLAQLADALDSELSLRLLVVVNEEHFDDLVRHPGLARARHFRLPPLPVGAALDACRLPVETTGGGFAPGVAEALVDDLRTVRGERRVRVQPLLLQLACAALPDGTAYVTRPPDVDRVIADHCDRLLGEVAADYFHGDTGKLRAQVRETFAGPVSPGEGGLPESVIDALVEHRLLRTVPGDGGPWHRLWDDRLAAALLLSGSGSLPRGPADAAGELRVAETALRLGHLDVAAGHAGAALAAAPRAGPLTAVIRSFLGDVAYHGGDLDAAVAHYRLAAQSHATARGGDVAVATLLTAAGRVLIRQGAFGDAIKDLRAACRRSPDDATIQTELAWALYYSGHESGAVDVLDGVLAVAGNATEALRARGEIMSDLQRPERALRDLERAGPLQQPSAQAAYALALAQKGEVSEAVRAIPPMDAEQDGPTLLRAARVMVAAGKHSEAVRLARRAREPGARTHLPPRLAAEADRLSE
ncbi:hypothetical protein ACBJ59_01510 [Nonomuraea sp. MTCD27]|uniref:tetratricopeptide repeat protein n=1 Tax=Nonomuraea sp. MTCD27 TaxID=1676747 RepID=UPI0035C00F1E